VLPALPICVFPRPVLIRDDREAVGEAINVLPEYLQAVDVLALLRLSALAALTREWKFRNDMAG
jgi:hypothetical protein